MAHVVQADPLTAVRLAHGADGDRHADSGGDDRVDVIGNYTAFDELLGASVTPRPGT